MEKFKKLAPAALLSILVLKGILTGIGFPEAISIVALAGLVFGMEKAEDSKRLEAIKKEHQAELSEIRKQTELQAKEIGEVKSYVSSVKLSQQYGGKR
jgi:hypothetical protein